MQILLIQSFLCFWLKVVEIVIPELNEMRTAHVVSIGSEAATSLSPDLQDGYTYIIWNF